MNASPLIFLTEVGLLEVLRQPGVPVLVPDTVLVEIGRLGPNDPAIQVVQQSGWMQIVPTPTIPDVVLVWDLDAGESAVLAVALNHPDSMAVLDDQPARRCAQVLNIPNPGNARSGPRGQTAVFDPGRPPSAGTVEASGDVHVRSPGESDPCRSGGVTVMPELEPWFHVVTPREVGKGVGNRPHAPWQQRA